MGARTNVTSLHFSLQMLDYISFPKCLSGFYIEIITNIFNNHIKKQSFEFLNLRYIYIGL